MPMTNLNWGVVMVRMGTYVSSTEKMDRSEPFTFTGENCSKPDRVNGTPPENLTVLWAAGHDIPCRRVWSDLKCCLFLLLACPRKKSNYIQDWRGLDSLMIRGTPPPNYPFSQGRITTVRSWLVGSPQ